MGSQGELLVKFQFSQQSSLLCQLSIRWCVLSFMFGDWDILEKIQTGGVEDILFLNPLSSNFQIFHFTFGNSSQNKLSPLEIPQNCVITLWKFQGQKPKPMEIPHDFFLNTFRNSTLFLIEPQNFHMLFLQHYWKCHVLNPTSPLCLDFLWNSLLPHVYEVTICALYKDIDTPTTKYLARYSDLNSTFD